MPGVGSDYLRRWVWGKRHKEKIHKQRGRRREVQELIMEWRTTLRQRRGGPEEWCLCLWSASHKGWRLGPEWWKWDSGKRQMVTLIANFTWRVKERSGQVTFQGCMFCQKTNEWYSRQTRKFIGNHFLCAKMELRKDKDENMAIDSHQQKFSWDAATIEKE